MEALSKVEARQELQDAYERIRSRLKTEEEMAVHRIPAERFKEARDRFERDRSRMWR